MQGFKILAALCTLVSLVAAKEGKFTFSKYQRKNVCANKDDGVFLAVAGSCSKYILCYQNEAIERDCGAYHFDAKQSACDLPERVGCMMPQTLTSLFPSKSVCAGKKDGTKMSVPGSNSKYRICKKEEAILHDCGSLKFDAVTEQCVSDKQVVIPNPTLPPCYAVANGIRLPVPGQPKQYYQCMNNKAFLKDCGHMYFDVKYSACNVLPSNANITPRPSILSPSKIPLNEQDVKSSVCHGKADGVRLSISGKPNQYYFCINNEALLKDCGSKMVFVEKYSACAFSNGESKELITVPELQISDIEAVARSVCKNKKFGERVPFRNHCSLYFICTYNTGFLKSCGWREFNTNLQVCDLPENVRCKATPPQIYTTQKPSTNSLAKRVCRNQNDGALVATPGNCNGFYFCLEKIGYLKNCGENRHFNAKNMMCVDAKNSKCVDVVLKKTQRAIAPRADSICANKENGTLLPGSDCGNFINCDNGVARQMDCPGGLHFSVEDNVCDWPINAKCA